MSSTSVTIIIPTIGRPTLQRAIDSVLMQTNEGWQCYVEGDGVNPRDVIGDPSYGKVLSWKQPHFRHESDMRNIGVTQADTEWVGFLDDDDTLSPNYVKWLKEEAADNDVVIFRQTFLKAGDQEATVFPSRPEIVWGNVGISYAIKREWALKHPFKRSRHEDLLQLVAVEAAGAKIHFSNHIAYYGRDHRG